jgi:hypothetical protein
MIRRCDVDTSREDLLAVDRVVGRELRCSAQDEWQCASGVCGYVHHDQDGGGQVRWEAGDDLTQRFDSSSGGTDDDEFPTHDDALSGR